MRTLSFGYTAKHNHKSVRSYVFTNISPTETHYISLFFSLFGGNAFAFGQGD